MEVFNDLRKVSARLQQVGGIKEIENPVTQVFQPLAEDYLPEKLHRRSNKIRSNDLEDRTPMKELDRPTYENVVDQVLYETVMMDIRDVYEEISGEYVGLDFEEGSNEVPL